MIADAGATLLLADALSWIEVALILFFLIFVMIVLRVVLARRGKYDDHARIPLDDEEAKR